MINFGEIYKKTLDYSYGYSMGIIWRNLAIEMKNMDEPYETRRDIFFRILEKLMEKGQIKLANNDEYLKGTIKEQLQQFKAVWPPYPSDDELDDLDDFGMWFLAKAPGGIVWITDNGQEIWT